jgi:hypothetical protein
MPSTGLPGTSPGPRTQSVPLPLQRRSPLLTIRDHLSLDASPSGICWALSRPSRTGLQLRECGVIEIAGRSEASLLREIARMPWVRFARVEVALRAPGLVHRRISLPAMSDREARHVARRKLEEFAKEQSTDCTASALCSVGSAARPAWLVVALASVPPVFEGRWRALGFRVHRLSSEPLALGNLGRILSEAPESGLTAILDVQSESGDCVVCDRDGWLFNRVIPLQRQGVSPVDASRGEQEAPPIHLERIVTELRRTFQYVEQELRLGRITRLVLSGSHPELPGVAGALEQALALPTFMVGDAITEGPARGLPPAAGRAVGIALSASAQGGNLLPPEIVRSRAERRARRTLVATLVSVCTTVALGLGAALTEMTWIQNDVSDAAQRMESDSSRLSVVQRAARIRQNAEALESGVAGLRRPEPPLASLLDSLRRIAPPDVALQALAIRHTSEGFEGRLMVEARGVSVAEAAQLISEFADTVTRTPLFAVRSIDRTLDAPQLQEGAAARVQFVLSGPLRLMVHDAPLPRLVALPRSGMEPAEPAGPVLHPQPVKPAAPENES